MAEISKALPSILEVKDMIVTEKGHLGLVQEGARISDSVYVLTRGEPPFVLRSLSPGHEGRFQFFSECYVHGVMDGEVINDEWGHDPRKFLIE
jgi:hypothetical protein